jgi:hypothetical protein
MRRTFITLLSAVALLMALAGAAHAGAFVPGSGTLTIRLAGLPPLSAGDNGTGATTAAGPILTETPALFGPVDIDIPDSLFTGVPQISDLRISQLGKPTSAATLSAGAGENGGFGGVAALAGNTTICVFSCVFIQVVIPLSVNGAAGTFNGTALGQPLTVLGGLWTTGAAQITGVNTELQSGAGGIICAPVTCPTTVLNTGTGNGVFVGTVTLTGTNGLSAGGGGTITLVTPTLTKSLAGNLPLFAIQSLEFVPEPAELLMLGAGAIVFGAYGWRRKRG